MTTLTTAKRLLICDDEVRFGRLVKKVAEALGYQVEVTLDGRGFMKAYQAFKPSTIVLDMVLPDADGNELILWLAEQQSSADLITITGYAPDYAVHAGTLAKFRGLRAIATLQKPVDIAQLRAVLDGPHYLP